MDDLRKYILDDLTHARSLGVDDPLFVLERARKFAFGYLYHRAGGIAARFSPDFYTYQAFIVGVVEDETARCLAALDAAPEHALGIALLEFAQGSDPVDYPLLASLAERAVSQAFSSIHEAARALLDTQSDYALDGASLRALARCHAMERYRDDVERFFEGAFKEIRRRAHAREGSEEKAHADLFSLVVESQLSLPPETRASLWPVVKEAFTYIAHEDRGYAARQAAAIMALHMTRFALPMPTDSLDRFVEVTGRHHKRTAWMGQARYVRDLVAGDPAPAMALLLDADAEGRRDYASATLADLHHPQALPALRELAERTDDPEEREALREAVTRLESQSAPPAIESRMIWMFGVASPTQQALGAASGNVFAERAWAEPPAVEETDAD